MINYELLRAEGILVIRPEGSLEASDFQRIAQETDPYMEAMESKLAPSWAVILNDGRSAGHHIVKVRIADGRNARGTGTALRVFHLLLN